MEAHPRLEPEAAGADLETAGRLLLARRTIDRTMDRVIIGQETVRELLMITLLARGHALLVGVPGLAKTLLVQSLARALDCDFNRIQFTPDLMPSDITGTEVIEEDPETGRRRLRFLPGPLFTHILLADEINRTPPKTQAALLQAMQEGEVTAGGATHPLEDPFFVLATQNPIEQEGTYPLPEAQLDRFMFELAIDYPERAEEIEIVRATTGEAGPPVEPVVSRAEVLAFQDLVRRAPVAADVVAYAVDLARRSRPGHPQAPEAIRKYVGWGAGPRAGQYLTLGAKTRALLQGRMAPDRADIRTLAPAVLRHRIVANYEAEAARVTVDDIVAELVDAVDRDYEEH
ncbi:MAG TPA: AAA family ATPase [Gemmatimonadota bacterium]|nr:AAA family ATPase [Gemmatimonadota bacterium]